MKNHENKIIILICILAVFAAYGLAMDSTILFCTPMAGLGVIFTIYLAHNLGNRN